MKLYGINIIADLIIKRYFVIVNLIKKDTVSQNAYFHEIEHILDLGKAFHLACIINNTASISLIFDKYII